ncbi:MAG: hypothetical protein M9894_35745 [Planctomycetes bacterium]|nr:hypothetical protein [Planctomycetota bacterium]
MTRSARRALTLPVALALAAAGAAGVVARAQAQDDDMDEGLEGGAGEPKAVLQRAIDAMGGADALRALTAVAVTFDGGAEAGITERHVLRLEGRQLHYASRDAGGAGFDVVIARGLAFLCDRGPDGKATFVDDLTAEDAREGAYERDMLFMPLLLPSLLADPRAALEHKGKSSQGEAVIKAVVHPVEGNPGATPFLVRLRFDPTSGLLTTAMGTVPCGADQGRKRYLSFQEPKRVGRLVLPHRYADQRAKDVAPREVAVSWALDAAAEPALFQRPTLLDKEGR